MNLDPKARLLDAAGEVFAEKGFEGATVRDICNRAEANVAAVNYYFGDKQQLYLEAVQQAHCMREPRNIEWVDGTPPEQKLRDFIRLMMEDMLDDDRPSWHLTLMMREMARPTAACEELVRSFIGPKFAVLLNILDELLPPGLSSLERHLQAFSIVGQCLLYRFHRPIGRLLVGEEHFQSFINLELLTHQITEFSLLGLKRIKAAGDVLPPTEAAT